LGRVAQAQGLLSDAQSAYRRTAALLEEITGQRAVDTAIVRRDLALATTRFGAVLDAVGDPQGRAEVDEGIRVLRELAAADTADARAQRDLASALVIRGDVLRAAAPAEARLAYSEARQLALALSAGRDEASGAAFDLAGVERRLADLSRGSTRADLKVFSLTDGRRTLYQLGDPALRTGARAAAAGTVPDGWSSYLLVFGSDGPVTVLRETERVNGAWTVTLDGPAPAQTLLLVGVPRALTTDEIARLASDVSAVAGPRTVDSDAQLIWSSEEVAIEGELSARGFGALPWVRAIRKRLEALGRSTIAGRTFSLASAR
jgi:hypothetical protein